LSALLDTISAIPEHTVFGRVTGIQGLMVEMSFGLPSLGVGSRVLIEGMHGERVPGEVVGFKNGRALCLPFGTLDGVRMGCRVTMEEGAQFVFPSAGWLGRVIDAFARPIDDAGTLPQGDEPRALRAAPPPAHTRARVGERLDLGVRVINAFTTTCVGQRMGIFAGSGVGKSVLLSMMARYTSADVVVIGLVGERGREVKEFIEEDLGPEGLKRSVVIVATSDEAALMRRQAAYLTLATAEYFRDQGLNVLCLMDSVTRFAMAQREIGLSSGEPPAAKGYTPTVFSELPRLLERAGPGAVGKGTITGLFTVLVEGDDHNEPIADAVRGILDGHIVLDRRIAERGRFPAVNVLRSVSRTMPACNPAEQQALIVEARRSLALYDDMAELVRLGAYKQGSDPELDRAIKLQPALETFMAQDRFEAADLGTSFAELGRVLKSGQSEGQQRR
jgi:flagellum-specific ATP synthase